MSRTRRIVVVLAAAGICAAGAGAGTFAAADSGPAQLQPAYVVRDAFGSPALAVQLQLGVRDTGSFDFSVSGVGDWIGVIPLGPVSSHITHLKGTVPVDFQAAGSSSTARATVRMEGQIDQSHASATVNVWVTEPGVPGQTHYLLHTANPGTSQAAGVARSALTALAAEDWATVYGLASHEITSRYSESQFVSTLAGEQQPAMSGAAFTGAGSTMLEAGNTYFVTPFTFTAVTAGQSTTYSANLTLVWEQGQWLFAGTSTPQPSS